MRHLLILLTALPAFAVAAETDQFTQDRLLNSIDGDQVQISLSKTQEPAGARPFVSLCLAVPDTHKLAKGLATQTHQPRFTEPDQVTCLRVAPRMQRIVLFTRSTTNAVQRSLAFTTDLTGFGGHQLDINWIVEAVE